MNLFAESEIGCSLVDRIQILPNYELTIYVDDYNVSRDDSEINFFVPGSYLLPVKGKAVVSRGEMLVDDIEYQDVTDADLGLIKRTIIRIK